MTRVSRRPLRKDIEERMFQIFWQAFAELKNENDVFDFLEDLLSPAEKIMLAKRLAVAVLLEKGWTYPEISSTLKVSTATVNTIKQKNVLLGKGFKKVIGNILKREEVSSFLEELAVTVASTIAPVGKIGIAASLRRASKSYQRQQQKKRAIL